MDSTASTNETDAVAEWGCLLGVDPSIHYLMGSVLAVVGTVGVLGNGIVLVVFTKYRRLRGPFSVFIVNLAVSDLCTSLLHSMVAASSFSRRWIFGRIGCQAYAFGVGHFGLLSIVTMAAIAVERYMVITGQPLSRTWKLTQYDSRKLCAAAWLYCLAMTVPPLLGWSRYVLEGLHTSCSWDYTTRTAANRTYYLYLLFFGFLVPVAVILYCYAFIMATILAHGRDKADGHVSLQANPPPVPADPHPLASSFRTAEIILVLVVLFLVSWTPYALVTSIAQFGDPRLITPWVAALPAFFAKASVVYNPIVYGLSHPHFRSAAKRIFLRCSGSTLSNSGVFSFAGGRARAAVSSPGNLLSATCKKQLTPDFHSDPGTRATYSLGGSRKHLVVTVHGHRRHQYNSTAVTSEGFDTIGPPLPPQADKSCNRGARKSVDNGKSDRIFQESPL